MRWLWYVLCVLSTLVAVRVVVMQMPVHPSGTARESGEMVDLVIGAFALPVIFFLLGIRASRRAKNRK